MASQGHPEPRPDPFSVELESLEEMRKAQRQAELDYAKADVERIHACLPEATLYSNKVGRAMTAWRWRMPDGSTEIRYESGWPASPSEFARPRDEDAVLISADELEILVPSMSLVRAPCTADNVTDDSSNANN